MDERFTEPTAGAERRTEVKKSRFIAVSHPVTCRREALARVEAARRDHPDARHCCWAYCIGPPQHAEAGLDDDGEPSGTAAKPILNVIRHRGLSNVLVIVIRYFGGIKLGAGGLIRAYAGAAQAVLETTPVREHVPTTRITLRCDFSREQPLRHWCDGHDAHIEGVDYANAVTVTVRIADHQREALREFCLSHGIETAPPGND